MSDSADGLSGLLADRYVVDRQIGQGGMATVYLAHDRRHDSKVAIKVLRPELASRVGGERFVREIRITAQLQHPNILPVYDSGEADGRPYYVMPYVEGETLEQRLKRSGPLPVDEAVEIAAEVANGLAYAHERGFVHRDVKPSNIMLSHGHALLADFGIARAVDAAGGEQLTETGHAIGTVAYMSPEQGHGEAIDGRSDIYSLGCVLYEMLAGTPPFTGSRSVVIARHSGDTIPGLRVVRDTVPEAVEHVIRKAMAKTPADRFAAAAAFRDALRRAMATGPVAVSAAPGVSVRTRMLAAVGVVAVGAVVWFSVTGGSAQPLDRSRVMMLPLEVSSVLDGPRSTGEDVATLVINALDGAGSLRWIDGLATLDPAARDTFRAPGLPRAQEMARAGRAAHFVTGSITPTGDGRISVALSLHDTETRESIARAGLTGESGDAWRLALRNANELLTDLIPGAPDVGTEWLDRQPTAIASFLRGEAAFRRVHLEEALGHYRRAVSEDSTFGLAAIRGAQAATWAHRPGDAESLIRIALRQDIPERYASFARGYDAYLAGNADLAATELRRAIQADPGMSAAWMQLGEVYTHLLPESGNPDSMALAAFREARRLDPTATIVLFHPIQIHLRRGEASEAAPLLAEFLAAEPEPGLAKNVEIMNRCVRDGVAGADFRRLAAEEPFALLSAAKSLGAAAARAGCAQAGFRALLEIDTSSTDGSAAGRRWSALIGLQGLLVSAGRTAEAMAVIDSVIARWGYGTTLFMLDALVDDAFAGRARAVIEDNRARFGDYADWPSTTPLWETGLVEASAGNAGEAEAIADELARRAATNGLVRDSLMSESVRAWAALARGDRAEALRRFDALVPASLPGGALSWDEAGPLGAERMMLAQLLLERGDYRRTIAIAEVIDSQEPIVYTMFVRVSLELRLQAAERLADPLLTARYRARLDGLIGEPRVTQ